MLKRYYSSSIKEKLIFIIMSIAVFAVALTTTAISIIGVYNLKQDIKEEIALATEIVGERNKYQLQFGNQAQVSKNLDIFKIKPSIEKSCIYDKMGNVFAFYPLPTGRSGGLLNTESGFKAASECPLFNQEMVRLTDTHMEVFDAIIMDGKQVGSIYVRSNLKQISRYINKQIIMAAFIILMVLIVSYILAYRMQREISRPILELAKAASRVSAYKDYSLRVLARQSTSYIEENYSKEIASLVKAFNNMLSDIEEHEQELDRNYKELELAVEQAESANLAKSQFIASISHELRTPLNAIIGFSTIINSQLFGEVSPKYLEYSKDIHDSGKHLLEIINDILDLSKAEAGKLTLQKDSFVITDAVSKCIRILQDKADKAHIEIHTEYASDLPKIVADRVRFIQIVLNLLSNAIKFSHEQSKILVRVGKKDTDDPTITQFHLRVEDSGIGMSQENINTALQSFGQIDGGLDRKYEGTGLGLPLTKQLVELHGGTLFIESEQGFGTTVHVILPSEKLQMITIH